MTRGSAPFGSRRAGSSVLTTEASSSSAQASWYWTTSSATETKISLPTSGEHYRHLHPRWVDSSPPTAGSHARQEMKRLMRGKYTTYTASAIAGPKTGKLKPPGRGVVSTWCNDSWAAITPETVRTRFKICDLTLALDDSKDHAWCTHNFGEGYRELFQQQPIEWDAAHPDVTLTPLQLP